MLEVGFGLKQDYYQCAILLSIIIPVLFNCTCANYNTTYIIAKGTLLILYLQMIKLVVG